MRNSIVSFGVQWALKSLEYSPKSIALFTAMRLASLYRLFDRRHREIARINLRIAFPDWTGSRQEAVSRESYRSLARLVVEVARLPHLNQNNISQLVRYDEEYGLHHYLQAAAQGHGVLFLTGHFSSFELLPQAHALYGYPLSFVVRPLDHPSLEAKLDSYRKMSGNRTIPKRGALRQILQTIRKKKDVGILIDQNVMPHEGIFVPFFGKAACTTSGLATIAIKTGAPIIPGRIQWMAGERRYRMKFYPALPLIREGDQEELLRINTTRFNQVIEDWIREDPGSWLWGHMRWRTRPPEDPDNPYKAIGKVSC